MKYNRQKEERAELEKKLEQYQELMSDLEQKVGSAEKLKEVLLEYRTYKSLKETMVEDSVVRASCERILERIDELLKDPETRDYLIELARENGLAFPDETIYYIDTD
ncbi:MAG: hypothetical protein IJR88_01705 [Clostridia bacterium]|nr:hypothetical protein [Clostridia bacterium]